MINKLKQLFTKPKPIPEIDNEQLIIALNTMERLEHDLKKQGDDIRFLIQRVDGRCVPEHLDRFQEIKKRYT